MHLRVLAGGLYERTSGAAARLYTMMLNQQLPAERRALYEEALARGRGRHYAAETRDVAIR